MGRLGSGGVFLVWGSRQKMEGPTLKGGDFEIRPPHISGVLPDEIRLKNEGRGGGTKMKASLRCLAGRDYRQSERAHGASNFRWLF